jgi:hypothetical protein
LEAPNYFFYSLDFPFYLWYNASRAEGAGASLSLTPGLVKRLLVQRPRFGSLNLSRADHAKDIDIQGEVKNRILHFAGNLVANHHWIFQHHASIRHIEHTLTVGPLVAVQLRRDIRDSGHCFFFLYSGLTARDIIRQVYCEGQALFFRFFLTFVEPAKIAQVIVKNLASPTGLLGHNEPRVRSDLHVALKALAGFVVHGDIISQVARQGQHLFFLFFPLDTKRKLDTTDGNKVDTANPLCLDELGHAVILQEVRDAYKGGNAFSFFLFKLAFILGYGKIPAAPVARRLCNHRAKALVKLFFTRSVRGSCY